MRCSGHRTCAVFDRYDFNQGSGEALIRTEAYVRTVGDAKMTDADTLSELRRGADTDKKARKRGQIIPDLTP